VRTLPRLAILLAALLGVTACTAPSPPPAPGAPLADAPVWPRPPEEARVRYLRTVGNASDWGVHKSIFRRALDALTGHVDGHLVRPTGVAVAGAVLYVADPGARALWIFDAGNGRSVRVEEIGGVRLASPVAVAARPDGSAYVADSVLKTVFHVGIDGALLGIAAQEGLQQPTGLAFDVAADRLFVADPGANRVVTVGPDARVSGARGDGGEDEGQFNRPTHIAVDASGTVIVTDALNFRIQAIDRDGRFLWKLGHHGDGSGDLAAPKGVASDRAGHIYVVDALFDMVQVFDRDGSFLLGFGGHGEGAGQFWLPNGLAIDGNDRLYVADAYNRRIEVFALLTPAAKESRP